VARLFISYRRSDTGAYAGRLNEELEKFPFETFYDAQSIEPGEKYLDRIHEELASSDATLVLIGPNWLDARDAEGNVRLAQQLDWVRREVTLSIDADLLVIPVLFDATSAPTRDRLPEPMRRLLSYDDYKINGEYFERDARDLGLRVEQALVRRRRARGEPDPLNSFRRQLLYLSGLLFLIAFCVAFAEVRIAELPRTLWILPASMSFTPFAWWVYTGARTGRGGLV